MKRSTLASTISCTFLLVFPHAWRVVSDPQGTKLILALRGGFEAFFDDLVTGASIDELTHRHGFESLR
jgi:hypothetical protein